MNIKKTLSVPSKIFNLLLSAICFGVAGFLMSATICFVFYFVSASYIDDELAFNTLAAIFFIVNSLTITILARSKQSDKLPQSTHLPKVALDM